MVSQALQILTLVAAWGPLQLNAAAQTTAAARTTATPTFDIVSIHPMRPDDPRPEHIDNPSRSGYLKATNVNLKSPMEIAYNIPDLRIVGGESWLGTQRFSLEARADPATDEQLAALPPAEARQRKRQMLVALLTTQCKLAVHRESKIVSVYALVVPKGATGLPPASPGTNTHPSGNERIAIAPGANSLEILAYELSWRLGRPVLDRTGLDDKQALTLRWRSDEAASDTDGPSLFTAIQEQLGLKLEATKAPVEVLVIDHAEKPADN